MKMLYISKSKAITAYIAASSFYPVQPNKKPDGDAFQKLSLYSITLYCVKHLHPFIAAIYKQKRSKNVEKAGRITVAKSGRHSN